MEEYHDVMLKDQPVGHVTVRKEGLYYKFTYTVRLKKGYRYRLAACSKHKRIDLGLCIPQGDVFTLSTKIPIKRFDKEKYDFILSDGTEKKMIPLEEHHPFPYLNILPDCSFARESGKAFIIVSQKSTDRV